MKYTLTWQDFMRQPENKQLKESKGIHACKQKYIQAYETEQNMIAQGYKKGKHDPYSDNQFEIDAENFAKKEKNYWIVNTKS